VTDRGRLHAFLVERFSQGGQLQIFVDTNFPESSADIGWNRGLNQQVNDLLGSLASHGSFARLWPALTLERPAFAAQIVEIETAWRSHPDRIERPDSTRRWRQLPVVLASMGLAVGAGVLVLWVPTANLFSRTPDDTSRGGIDADQLPAPQDAPSTDAPSADAPSTDAAVDAAAVDAAAVAPRPLPRCRPVIREHPFAGKRMVKVACRCRDGTLSAEADLGTYEPGARIADDDVNTAAQPLESQCAP
jgi:hypothetical protein